MNDNIKLEVAIEIMASKIASMAKKGYDNNSKEMKKLLEEKREYCYTIPMIEHRRSLNLSNSVAIVLYEAIRHTYGA